MTVIHAPDVTDKFTTQFIRRHAKALVNDGVFPQSELEDVIQELRLALIDQASNFDPEKARWSTFVKIVVRLTAISLRRRQKAQCRERECELSSLDVLIEDDDGQLVVFGSTVSEEEYRTGSGQGFISHSDQVGLSVDVQSVVEQLPAELQEICQRLAFQTPTEVRRELGISRTTMQRRLESLREHFRAAGVGELV